MPQSLSNILLHIIFSTKNRMPLITSDNTSDLYAYIASISRAHGCPVHQIGGTENHIHICCSLARTQTCAKLVEEIKTGATKWIKTKGLAFASFAWQNGYGAFSIAQDQLDAVKQYIKNQQHHHTKVTFEEEFLALLKRFNVPYDEKYVWD
jgi:putative transposase